MPFDPTVADDRIVVFAPDPQLWGWARQLTARLTPDVATCRAELNALLSAGPAVLLSFSSSAAAQIPLVRDIRGKGRAPAIVAAVAELSSDDAATLLRAGAADILTRRMGMAEAVERVLLHRDRPRLPVQPCAIAHPWSLQDGPEMLLAGPAGHGAGASRKASIWL